MADRPLRRALPCVLAVCLFTPAVADGAERDAARLASMADRASAAFVDRQADSGHFLDPVTGRVEASYGTALFAYGLLRAGARQDDGDLVAAGVRALDAALSLPRSERGVFVPWAVSSAYNFAVRRLPGVPEVRASRGRWESFLRATGRPVISHNLRPCHASASCFHNHELVEALGDVELLRTGLSSGIPGAKLSDRPRLRRRALALIHQAERAVGGGARSSLLAPRGGLGLLTDSGNFPLGYHSLTTAFLARALTTLGADAPDSLRGSVVRAVDALSAFMAPDGDVSYIGRGQQQAWTSAASAYLGALGAARYGGTERRRRLAGVAHRALERLRRLYIDRRGYVSPLPRRRSLATGSGALDIIGVNSVGLAIWALNVAADEARAAPPLRRAALPADRDGWFVDPDQAKLAAVRRGRVWFAVHSRPFTLFPQLFPRHRRGVLSSTQARGQFWDLRHDFGVVALKLRDRGGRWLDLVRPRPVADDVLHPPESAGPTLLGGNRGFLPFGHSIGIREDGVVRIEGGFRSVGGRWARRGVRFRFSPLRDGVRLDFQGRRGDVFRMRAYLPAATRWLRGGLARDAVAVVEPPTGAREWRPVPGYASCCDDDVTAASIDVQAERDGRLTQIIRARRVERPGPAAAITDESRDVDPVAVIVLVLLVVGGAAGYLSFRRASAPGA